VTSARALTVSDILTERAHVGEPPRTLVFIMSVIAHVSFLAGLALVSRPRPVTFVPSVIRVGVVNPAALARPALAPPVPAPVPQAPPEPKKGRPVIEKAKPEIKPSAKAMPEPKAAKKKPEKEATSPKSPPSAEPAIELPSSPTNVGAGGPGSLAFGTSVAGLDVDFPFAYYVDQLLSLIGANWLKPSVSDGTACVVSFHILRSGQITDVKLETPSGLPFYDRAAARAVYAANPLPPLPQGFNGETLGVHLRFQ
jgi:protein TonB